MVVDPFELCFREGRGWIEFRQVELENYFRFASIARAAVAKGVWDDDVVDAVIMIRAAVSFGTSMRLRLCYLAFLAKLPPALLHAVENPPDEDSEAEGVEVHDGGCEPGAPWSPDGGHAA